MPRKDPNCKEAIEYQRKWWDENKHKKNKEQIRINNRKYLKSPKGVKASKIRSWRLGHNIVCDDWNDFYNNRWLTTSHCESCNLEFGNERKNRKNLDHQHSSKHIRHIVCHPCNAFRAKHDKDHKDVLLELHRYFNLNLI